jgi:hypothetical protein
MMNRKWFPLSNENDTKFCETMWAQQESGWRIVVRYYIFFYDVHIFCVKVISIVQDNFPMKVFSIDTPFKGSQSHSNMRSKVTAVSYLLNGVNDSTVHVTAVSMTLLCVRCQWLRCVELFAKIFKKSLRIRSHIRKGFYLCIKDLGEDVWWNKQRSKISCQG